MNGKGWNIKWNEKDYYYYWLISLNISYENFIYVWYNMNKNWSHIISLINLAISLNEWCVIDRLDSLINHAEDNIYDNRCKINPK